MDGSRDIVNIKNLIKDKNIFSVTYDSIDILNKIIKYIENKIIFIDEYHNLSMNNLENNKDNINKLLISNNKIIFMSATPLINEKYSNIFGDYIYKYDWKKAIENKYICDFNIIFPDKVDDINIFKELLNNINYKANDKELVTKIYFILKGMLYYGSKKTILYSTSIEENIFPTLF